jgi:hypothetical protein
MADPVKIVIDDDDDAVRVDPVTGTVEIPTDDGGVVVQLDALRGKKEGEEDEFYKNLAEKMGEEELTKIANDLYEAISADDKSRQEYLNTRARGLDLMGIKLPPKESASMDDGPVEGQSRVTNPLLLEAVLKGWANSVGEFLPANGPVKIRDDGEDETAASDDLAEALERDMNHYLTKVATEFYPETSHLLLWGCYFGGSGFKKVHRCPMRRRPVSESIDAQDLIVSDTAKDLRSCERITHQIAMRPSVMKRMQFLGAYVDIDLPQPTPSPNAVTQKIAGIQGTSPTQRRPEDEPYTLWETQCELDLPDYAPTKFKKENIPLPYLVTLDKDSRKILALRRDWHEDDEEAERKRLYVKWPYVPGPGFYGTGLLNILGNSTLAMTSAWREALDAGMFASFPGGFVSKAAARQNSSNMRPGPGQFIPLETNNMPISQLVSPLPYRDATPGLMAMIDKITDQSRQASGQADIPSAEGLQNVPVGTMLAQVEQATRVMSAAHKGMHQAQSEEFDLIIELFRENPEDFVRCSSIKSRKRKGFWDEGKFLQALAQCNLVPVSDPNVPSHIHRVSKALAIVQLSDKPQFQPLMDPKEVLLRCLRALKEDAIGLIREPPPSSQQPDPNMIAAQAQALQAQARVMSAQSQAAVAQAKQAQIPETTAIQREKMETQRAVAQSQERREEIIHQADQAKMLHQMEIDRRKQGMDASQQEHKRGVDAANTMLEAARVKHEQGLGAAGHGLDMAERRHQAGLDVAKHRHEATMDVAGHQLEQERVRKEHAVKMKIASKPVAKPAASKKK